MSLEQATESNLKYILEDLTDQLGVANHALMDPEDYDLSKYDEIKMMHEMIKQKGQLSTSETEAFINELKNVRKS